MRLAVVSSVVIAALVLPSLARAESFLDRVAPEPAVAKWIAGAPAPGWKSLKGRCALLELLDPDDLVSDGLVSRTAEIAARAERDGIAVVSIAVGSGSDEGTAMGFAKRRNITWSFGTDREGATYSRCAPPQVPWYYLMAPDGRVVWEGSSGDLDDATLNVHLARARLWRPEQVTKVIRPAAAAYASGKYAEAVRLAREAMVALEKRTRNDLPVEGGEEKDVALIEDAVKSTAEARFVLAARLEVSRDSLDCLEILEGVEKEFHGTPSAEEAKKKIEELRLSDKHSKEIEQGKRLRDILEKIRPPTKRNLEKGLEALDLFIEHNVNMRILVKAQPERDRVWELLNPKKKEKEK